MQTQHDVFSNDLPTPTLPRRAAYSAMPAASPVSRAPAQDGQKLDTLDPLQRQRLQNDREQSLQLEQDLNKVAHGSCSVSFAVSSAIVKALELS